MHKEEDAVEAGSPPSPTADVDAADAAQSSKKRKTNHEEIEVDVAAPEPPSKKARRAMKKGKEPTTTSKSKKNRKDNDNDLYEDGEEEAKAGDDAEGKKTKVRSEHAVWVGNLPFTVTPLELRQWLVDNSGGVIVEASITRIKMPMSKDKPRPARGAAEGDNDNKRLNKGFAYVDFDGIGPQMAALALSENKIGYRSLLIKDAKSFEGRPKAEKEEAKAEGDDAAEKKKKDEADRNANRKVFVGNLGFATTEDDLWHHFQKCGEIEWIKIATFEDTGKCKGYGWVKFKTPEGAAWAAKGFVKIKEEVLTEEDFRGPDDADDGDAGGKADEQPRKHKMRKWWVNKLKGRDLKIEMAEDDQSRYKKRFTKDKTGKQKGPHGKKGDAHGGETYVQDAVKSAMELDESAVA